MPVQNISKIQSLLFGFCCMAGEERENVHAWWQERFSGNTAFLIDVEQKTAPQELIEQLEKAVFAQNIRSIQNKSVIITFFYDLTEEINPKWLDVIWSIQKRIDQYFKTISVLSLQFGYVGKLNLISADKQRATAKTMIERNSIQAAAVQHRLFLIARPSLAGHTRTSWKAAIVLLDVLRRQASPSQLLPSTTDGNQNNDVAFLRYEEFDEAAWSALAEKRRSIEHLLHDYDKQEFTHRVDQFFADFKKEAAKQFSIDGKAQPQHAGVIVSKTKKCFLSGDPIAKAKHGKNQDYNAARDETYQAVSLTADRLKRSILELCEPKIDRAPETLSEMMMKSELGMKLKRNQTDMHALLNAVTIDKVKVPDLQLRYSEAGLASEIEAYLNAVKWSAINEALRRMRNALIKAYDDITEEKLSEEEALLVNELGEVNSKLANLQTAPDFCSSIAFQRDPAICNFTCNVGNGSNVKMLICRDSRMNAIITETDKAGATNTYMFEISERGGGVQKHDSAPLKALQVVVLDGTDPVMQALLPDVEE